MIEELVLRVRALHFLEYLHLQWELLLGFQRLKDLASDFYISPSLLNGKKLLEHLVP